jgi:GNAT superfamily N-acetyltransferase
MAMRRKMYVHLTGNVVDGTVSLKGDTIYAFFVAPDRQGTGIGSSLLAYVEEVARSQGLQSLTVDASITARRFYERRHYRLEKIERDGNYGTVITMKKDLQVR